METICAISTPQGVGGIAVIRLSGDNAVSVAEKVLRNKTGKPVKLRDHKALFLQLFDADEFLDEVIVTLFATPHSYTGEDVVEISCHGSLYVQRQILQVLINQGARIAEPGEFTLRAFLNGQLDLSQSEAVADLIDSQSQLSHRLAVSQLRGGYAKELELLRQQLIDTTALMELELDFSDEDVEFANRERLKETVSTLTTKVQRLVGSFQDGNVFKNGIPVAIIGRPNAGKSTLLNALLNEDRAIVSPIPGTTRDTVEETMTIDGIMFRFIDTAGLPESDDPLENIGFGRSLRAAKQAKIILFVRNVTVPFDEYAFDDIAYFTESCNIKEKHYFIVHNKCDLPHDSNPPGHIVSAKEGTGIDKLKRSIAAVAKKDLQQNDGVMLTNARHYEAMKKVLSALDEVHKGLDANLTPDLLVIDMRDALYHLGTITGKVAPDEVLSSVFSRFCIGK